MSPQPRGVGLGAAATFVQRSSQLTDSQTHSSSATLWQFTPLKIHVLLSGTYW